MRNLNMGILQTSSWRYLLFLIFAMLCHLPAHAGLKFGSSESIRFVANVKLEGPNNEKLYLGRKIETSSFLLPYSIQDHGFVLGVAGDTHRYYPMPDETQIKAMQEAGNLPQPLPAFELDNDDWFVGHLLWIFIVGMLMYFAYLKMTGKLSSSPKSVPNSSLAPNGIEPRFDSSAQPSAPSVSAIAANAASKYLDELQLPRKLGVKRGRLMLFLAGSVAFAIASFFMIKEQPLFGSFALVFSVLCILAFSLQLMPGRCYLELTRDGFSYVVGIRKAIHYRWSDIGELGAIKLQKNEMIAWTYSASYTGKKHGAVNSYLLAGYEMAIGNIYDINTAELLQLMRSIKQATDTERMAANP